MIANSGTAVTRGGGRLRTYPRCKSTKYYLSHSPTMKGTSNQMAMVLLWMAVKYIWARVRNRSTSTTLDRWRCRSRNTLLLFFKSLCATHPPTRRKPREKQYGRQMFGETAKGRCRKPSGDCSSPSTAASEHGTGAVD